jgi:hypothetical protein
MITRNLKYSGEKESTQSSNVSKAKAGGLEVKVAHSAQDWRRAKEALGREHGLRAGSEAGDRLCQLVMEDGKLAGVLVWCAAAWQNPSVSVNEFTEKMLLRQNFSWILGRCWLRC